MIAKELRSPVLTHCLKFLEKVHHGSGIVTAVAQDLCAHEICLAFRISGILQEERIQTESGAELPENRAHRTRAKNSSKNGERRLCNIRSGYLMGSMTKNDVADL